MQANEYMCFNHANYLKPDDDCIALPSMPSTCRPLVGRRYETPADTLNADMDQSHNRFDIQQEQPTSAASSRLGRSRSSLSLSSTSTVMERSPTPLDLPTTDFRSSSESLLCTERSNLSDERMMDEVMKPFLAFASSDFTSFHPYANAWSSWPEMDILPSSSDWREEGEVACTPHKFFDNNSVFMNDKRWVCDNVFDNSTIATGSIGQETRKGGMEDSSGRMIIHSNTTEAINVERGIGRAECSGTRNLIGSNGMQMGNGRLGGINHGRLGSVERGFENVGLESDSVFQPFSRPQAVAQASCPPNADRQRCQMNDFLHGSGSDFDRAVGGHVTNRSRSVSDTYDDNASVSSVGSSCEPNYTWKPSKVNNHVPGSFEIGHWSDFVQNSSSSESFVNSAPNVTRSRSASVSDLNENRNDNFEIGHWEEFAQNNNIAVPAESALRIKSYNNVRLPGMKVNMLGNRNYSSRMNYAYNNYITANGERFCAFCKRNGETREYYTTHIIKDNKGKVICPVLRKYVCPECGATGDNAHTISHCPVRKANALYNGGF